jgi:hypothetical protein
VIADEVKTAEAVLNPPTLTDRLVEALEAVKEMHRDRRINWEEKVWTKVDSALAAAKEVNNGSS